MPEERTTITDPKALRALAHPLRWKLLDLIFREGTATATRCAEETGESVANCSYHLNTLAKYGYVEQAGGGQGREKPWRALTRTHSWNDTELDTAEGVHAAQAATMAFLDFELNQIRERNLVAHLEPEDWRSALGSQNTNEYLTPGEVVEVREEVRAILERFRDRHDNPAARPDGARYVNFFVATTVAPSIKPE